MLHNEYRYNKRFRDYVDRYCKKHNITVDEALEHEVVKAAYRYYTEV